MFRRFLSGFFWNFYDYLGSYLGLGFLVTSAVLLVAAAGAVVVQLPFGFLRFPLLLLAIVAVVAMVAFAMAGLMRHATRAAKDEPARLRDFRGGIRELGRPYLKSLGLWILAVAVVAANVAFYGSQARAATGAPARGVLVTLSMLFLWIGIGLSVFSLPWFAAPARFGPDGRLRDWARKAFILFAVAPLYWLFAWVFVTAVFALCAISVVGVIFLLPVFCCASATAIHVAHQHADFLADAREKLGDGRTVGEYRRKALELAAEWEAAQPRRTLRELIKPWEN